MYRTPKFDSLAHKTINHDTALQDFNYNYLCVITDRTEIVFVGKSLHITVLITRRPEKEQFLSLCYLLREISGFRREVAKNCALVGYYAASSGNFLPTFRDNLSVPTSGFNNKKIMRIGSIGCPETLVRNYHYSLRDNPEESGS